MKGALQRLPLGMAVASLAVGAAAAMVGAAFGPLRWLTSDAVFVFPWTVRVDLWVLVSLCVLVTCVLLLQIRPPEARVPLERPATWILLLLGCIAVFGTLALDLRAGVIVLLFAAAILLIGPLFADAAVRTIWPILAVAFSLRALVAFGFELVAMARSHGLSPAVLDDEEALHRAAVDIARILTAGQGDIVSAWWHLLGPYLASLSHLYLAFGADFTMVRLLNAAVATIGVAVAYGLTRHLFGETAARAAGWTLAVWPSLVLWGGTGLREAFFGTATLLVPWLAIRQLSLPRSGSLVLLGSTIALALLMAASLRGYAAAALLLAMAVPAVPRILSWARASRTRAVGALAVAAVVSLVAVAALVPWLRAPQSRTAALLDNLTPRGVEYRAAALELSTIPEVDSEKWPPLPEPGLPPPTSIIRVLLPGDARLTTAVVIGYEDDPLRYVVATHEDTFHTLEPSRVQPLSEANVTWDVPLSRFWGGLRVLFLPVLAWSGDLIPRAVTIPDTAAWDALFVLCLIALWRGRRSFSSGRIVVLVYLAVMLLAMGLVSTNLGTAVRHRTLLVPWVAILAAPMLGYVFEQRGRVAYIVNRRRAGVPSRVHSLRG